MNERTKTELLKTQRTASFPYLVHIYNEDYGDFYYANYYKDVTYNGKTYLSSVFEIIPPSKTQSQIGNASFSFSVVDQTWIEKIRNTQKRSTIEFVGVILFEDDTVQTLEENRFILTSATWNESTVKWEMVFDERLDILAPCDVMNSLNCAGCV